MQWRLVLLISVAFVFLAVANLVSANPQPPDSEPTTVANAVEADEVAERYLTLLRRNPRFGTAFDRLVEFHLASGTMPELLARLQSELESSPEGNTALLIGMLHSRRGDEQAAIAALQKAEELLPKQSLASFYLGRSLATTKQLDPAIEAMRRGLQKKPNRQDLLMISLELGRLFQNSHRNDEALQTWEAVEKEFPTDAQIRQQIAAMLADNGQWQPALQRYEQLAKSTRDPYQQVEWGIRAAELKVKLGKQAEALAEFEVLLPKVNPESWLHGLIRDQIDAIFLESVDYDGLIEYYTKWSSNYPEDVDAMVRCGRLLSIHSKLADAETWFRRAIERAPSDAGARIALVDALERDERLSLAAAAMHDLVDLEPNNVDYVVRWGQIVVSNRELSSEERKQQASKIWGRLLEKQGRDPVIVTRLADLLRGAGLATEAIAQYQSAIELADDQPQYREYLGEYLQQLGRTDEALEVWRQIAEGPRENLDNLVRLSEIMSTFRYPEKALDAMARACQHKPKLQHRLRLAKLLREAKRFEEALAQVELVGQQVESDEEQEELWNEEIEIFAASDQLQAQIDLAAADLATVDANNSHKWQRQALLLSAAQQGLSACKAIERARELEPRSIRVHQISIRLHEENGNLGVALDGLKQLSSLDRPSRSNYVTQIASLQLRLGMVNEALETARELISSESATTEQYRYYVDLCYQAGQPELAIETLRRCLVAHPNDAEASLMLAQKLANQFENREAIELSWSAFEKAKNLEDREQILPLITELYLRSDDLDDLLQRLELFGRERNRRSEGTLLRARANEFAGYFLEARELLEDALGSGKNEALILERLKNLALADDDYEAAAKYQQRMNQLAPTVEGQYSLARLYVEIGDFAAARNVWQSLQSQSKTAEELTKQMVGLLSRGDSTQLSSIADEGLEQFPDNWEIASYAILAYRMANDNEKANRAAESILAMRHPFALPAPSAQSGANPNAILRTRVAWYSRSKQIGFRFQPNISPLVYTRMAVPTLECFGDARAIAIFQQATQTAQEPIQERLDAAIAAKDRDAMWELLLQLPGTSQYSFTTPTISTMNGQVTILSGSGGVVLRGNETLSSEYQKLFVALLELGEIEAGEILLNQMQSQRQIEMSLQSRANTQNLVVATQPYDATQLSILRDVALKTRKLPNLLFAMQEFHRAGRKEDADDMLALLSDIEGTPASLASTAVNVMATHSTAGLELMQRAIEEAKNSASGLTSIAPMLVVFVSMMTQATADQIRMGDFLEATLRAHAAYVRSLRPSQLVSDSTPARQASYAFSTLGSATRVQTTTIPFPLPSAVLSREILQVLHAIHNCKNPDLQFEVEKVLNQLADQKQDPYLQTVVLACRATWCWWDAEKELALEDVTLALETGVGGEAIAMLAFKMLTESGNYERALEHLEKISPSNPSFVLQRELAILELSLKLGETDRAEVSARKLFALEMDTATQLKLAQTILSMGMNEMSESIMARLKHNNSEQATTQAELLKHYQSTGDEQAATAIAKSILRRTKPKSQSNSATRSIPSTNQRATTAESARSLAISYLRKLNLLDEMIQDTLKSLEATPESNRLKDQLYELYTANGNPVEAAKYSAQVSSPATITSMQRTLGSRVTTPQTKETVQKFIGDLKANPQLSSQIPQMISTIQNTSSWTLLAEAMVLDNRIQLQAPFLRMMMDGLVRENSLEIGVQLVKNRLASDGLSSMAALSFLLSPFARSGMRSEVISEKFFDEELAKSLVDQLLKTTLDSQAKIAFISAYPVGQGLQGPFQLLSRALSKHPQEKKRLLTKLEEVSPANRSPSVNLLLSLLYVDQNQVEEAIQAFHAATHTSPQIVSAGIDGVWELGTILAIDHQRCDAVAESLFLACKSDPAFAANPITYLPLLLECAEKTGQASRVELTLDALQEEYVAQRGKLLSDPVMLAYRNCQQLRALADCYLRIGSQFKAIQVNAQAERELKKIPASHSLRRSADSSRKELKTNISYAQLVETLDNALTVAPEKLVELEKWAVLMFPESSATAIPTIYCDFQEILKTVGHNAADYEKLRLQLVSLPQKSDSVLVLLACFAITAADLDALQVLGGEVLRREKLAERDRSHQQRQLSLMWFANHLEGKKPVEALELELRRAALAYSNSDFNRAFQGAMQKKIVSMLENSPQLELEDRQVILRDLLERLPRDAYPRYEMAWSIANAAMNGGLNELSMDAAKIAFENGPPIQPASQSSETLSASQIMTAQLLQQQLQMRSTTSVIQTPDPPAENSSAKQIVELAKKWHTSGASASQMTDALFNIVFPSQGHHRFYRYASLSETPGKQVFDEFQQATPEKIVHPNVMAELLIHAHAANQVDVVLAEAARRAEGSATRQSQVGELRIAAALLNGDTDQASQLWKEMFEADQTRVRSDLSVLLNIAFHDPTSGLADWLTVDKLLQIPARELSQSTQLQWLLVWRTHQEIDARNAEAVRKIVDRITEVFAYRNSSKQVRLSSLYNAIVDHARARGSSEIADIYLAKLAELH